MIYEQPCYTQHPKYFPITKEEKERKNELCDRRDIEEKIDSNKCNLVNSYIQLKPVLYP